MTSGRCSVSHAMCVFGVLVWFAMAAHAQEDRSHWVDPNDMLNFDLTTGEMKNKPTKDRVNEVCQVCVS